MRLLLLSAVLFTTSSGYLDYFFKIDRRFENENGEINPLRLAKRLYRYVYNNLSMDATNDQAWAQLRTVLYHDYSQHSAQVIDSMFTALASVVNETLLGYQEMYIGNYIDSFNMLMTGTVPRNLSSATRRGIALFQTAGQIFSEGVAKPFAQGFYNPFNTDMIAKLNKSEVATIKRSFFDIIRCSNDYYISYSNSFNSHNSFDYNNYMSPYDLK